MKKPLWPLFWCQRFICFWYAYCKVGTKDLINTVWYGRGAAWSPTLLLYLWRFTFIWGTIPCVSLMVSSVSVPIKQYETYLFCSVFNVCNFWVSGGVIKYCIPLYSIPRFPSKGCGYIQAWFWYYRQIIFNYLASNVSVFFLFRDQVFPK